MKKKSLATAAIIALLLIMWGATALVTAGCSAKHDNDDTVAVAVDTMSFNGAFIKSNGMVCRQRVTLKVTYPSKFKDERTLARLQHLFATTVLDAPDSVDLAQAIPLYGRSIIIQDTPQVAMNAPADTTLYDDDGAAGVDSIATAINVTVQYNAHNILTVCREEIVTKNNLETSRLHRYFNLDLEAMALIEVNRMFKDISIDDITTLLTKQLMEQNEVTTEDQLNDMGYFNLPIVEVSNNFYFTHAGLTWSYEPNTLAVATIGEPKIHLTFDALKEFYLENSVLNRF